MKTFRDLKFHEDTNDPEVQAMVGLISILSALAGEDIPPIGDTTRRARLFFENGYGVSVIQGQGAYVDESEDQYEVAVLKGTEDGWYIAYGTHITDNVLGYLTPDEVTNIIQDVQSLPEV